MNKTTARLGKRIGAGGALAVLAAAMTAGPAGAASSGGTPGKPEVYAGTANGTALSLTLFGHQITEGVSNVSAASTLKTVAHAVGAVVDGVISTQNTASASSPEQVQVVPEQCATPAIPALPSPLPTVQAGLACAASSVSTKNSIPVAGAVGRVADMNLSAAGLVNTLTQTLQPILAPIQSIFGNLGQTAPSLDPVTNTVGQLLQAVGTQNTLNVSLGNTTSTLVAAAGSVTSKAVASGGDIQILGLNVLPNSAPLAEIKVGSSQSQVVYDRATGKATPSFDPAIVTVILNPLPATGLAQQVLTVAPGQSVTILQGTPLESTISVAKGSTAQNADGSVSATASAVELDLLKGIGASSATATDGGIDLALAKTTASGGGTPAVPAVAAPKGPAVATPVKPQLPFTGSTPVLPLAGAGLLGVSLIGRRMWRMVH